MLHLVYYARFTSSGVEGRTTSDVKSDIGLGLVENTAVSSWTGSTNIATVGALTSYNINPSLTDYYPLGSTTKRWSGLHLGSAGFKILIIAMYY